MCLGGVKVDKAHRWTTRVRGRVILATELDELRNRVSLVARVMPTGIPLVTTAQPLYDVKLLESDGHRFTLTGYEYSSGGTPPRIQIVGQTWVMTPLPNIVSLTGSSPTKLIQGVAHSSRG